MRLCGMEPPENWYPPPSPPPPLILAEAAATAGSGGAAVADAEGSSEATLRFLVGLSIVVRSAPRAAHTTTVLQRVRSVQRRVPRYSELNGGAV